MYHTKFNAMCIKMAFVQSVSANSHKQPFNFYVNAVLKQTIEMYALSVMSTAFVNVCSLFNVI